MRALQSCTSSLLFYLSLIYCIFDVRCQLVIDAKLSMTPFLKTKNLAGRFIAVSVEIISSKIDSMYSEWFAYLAGRICERRICEMIVHFLIKA